MIDVFRYTQQEEPDKSPVSQPAPCPISLPCIGNMDHFVRFVAKALSTPFPTPRGKRTHGCHDTNYPSDSTYISQNRNVHIIFQQNKTAPD